jgi:hypothetical protein
MMRTSSATFFEMRLAINSRMCLCVSCACSGVATCFVFRVWRRRVERSETGQFRISGWRCWFPFPMV